MFAQQSGSHTLSRPGLAAAWLLCLPGTGGFCGPRYGSSPEKPQSSIRVSMVLNPWPSAIVKKRSMRAISPSRSCSQTINGRLMRRVL